jgi:hypothetical protein
MKNCSAIPFLVKSRQNIGHFLHENLHAFLRKSPAYMTCPSRHVKVMRKVCESLGFSLGVVEISAILGCCILLVDCSSHFWTTYQSCLQGQAVQEECWSGWILACTGTVYVVTGWQEHIVAEQQGWWGARRGHWSHIHSRRAQWNSHQGMGAKGRLETEGLLLGTVKQPRG